MKARLLKKLLNDTGYNVHDTGTHIAVGSPYCPTLLTVDKTTMDVSYALDTFRSGRTALGNAELRFIWDKLHDLIASGEIHHIINGDDEIENPLPVFTVNDGQLVETFTDAYGWPNVTISGELMYDNTWFKTKKEAIAYGIKDMGYALLSEQGRKDQAELKLQEAEAALLKYEMRLRHLESLL